MANVLSRMRAGRTDEFRLTIDELAKKVSTGSLYGYASSSHTLSTDRETIGTGFGDLVSRVHERHGVVAACVFARQLVLSEVRFRFRGTFANTEPGKLVGAAGLSVLEHPSPDTTRPTLVKRAESHVSYAGNAFFHRPGRGAQMTLLRPDWVTIALGSESHPDDPAWAEDVRVVGYAYTPGGGESGVSPRGIMPAEVAHWAPEPDPASPFRGQSWVRSVLSEITTDRQAADHTANFFANGATPNMIVSTDANLNPDQARELYDSIQRGHAGSSNAYKTLLLTAGADAKVVGSDLSGLSLGDITGGYEARIAARARVPAVVLGTREGSQASALNNSFYGAARRMWADAWFSPTVQDLCAALDPLIDKPGRTDDLELWYDASDVRFLQEDMHDLAEIQQAQAITIRQLVDGGFDPASAVAAVVNDDMTQLTHTGKLSVQLQEPGTEAARAVDEVERDEHGRVARVIRAVG